MKVEEMRFLSSKALTQAFQHDHLQRARNLLIDFSKLSVEDVSNL